MFDILEWWDPTKPNQQLEPLHLLKITARLHSVGGSIEEGLRLGDFFRKYGVGARVEAHNTCESACAVAFMGGARFVGRHVVPDRSIDPTASLGFHAPFIAQESLVEEIAAAIPCEGMTDETCQTKRSEAAGKLAPALYALGVRRSADFARRAVAFSLNPVFLKTFLEYDASELFEIETFVAALVADIAVTSDPGVLRLAAPPDLDDPETLRRLKGTCAAAIIREEVFRRDGLAPRFRPLFDTVGSEYHEDDALGQPHRVREIFDALMSELSLDNDYTVFREGDEEAYVTIFKAGHARPCYLLHFVVPEKGGVLSYIGLASPEVEEQYLSQESLLSSCYSRIEVFFRDADKLNFRPLLATYFADPSTPLDEAVFSEVQTVERDYIEFYSNFPFSLDRAPCQRTKWISPN